MNRKPASRTTGRATVHGATILPPRLLRASLVGMLATACVTGGHEYAPGPEQPVVLSAAAAATEDAEAAARSYLQPMRPMTWDQSEDHRRQLRHAEALRRRETTPTADEGQARGMTWDESEEHRRQLQHAEALRRRGTATGCAPGCRYGGIWPPGSSVARVGARC